MGKPIKSGVQFDNIEQANEWMERHKYELQTLSDIFRRKHQAHSTKVFLMVDQPSYIDCFDDDGQSIEKYRIPTLLAEYDLESENFRFQHLGKVASRENINALIADLGMTRTQIAKANKIPYPALVRVLTKDGNWSRGMSHKVAVLLGLKEGMINVDFGETVDVSEPPKTSDELVVHQLEVSASALVINCPGCGTIHDGFVSDPMGTSFDCEGCGNKVTIPVGIPVKLI
jgi:gp16 family phage-associated protein